MTIRLPMTFIAREVGDASAERIRIRAAFRVVDTSIERVGPVMLASGGREPPDWRERLDAVFLNGPNHPIFVG